jgi:hypothetical protein
VFAPVGSPEVIGYCGDLLFAVQTIGQFVQRQQHGFKGEEPSGETTFKILSASLRDAFSTYPATEQRGFDVLLLREESRVSEDPEHGWHLDRLRQFSLSGMLRP